jgi:hypothetical protein
MSESGLLKAQNPNDEVVSFDGMDLSPASARRAAGEKKNSSRYLS